MPFLIPVHVFIFLQPYGYIFFVLIYLHMYIAGTMCVRIITVKFVSFLFSFCKDFHDQTIHE